MKVIRQVGKYSLMAVENIDSELNYYIDNGEDVTEYFDKYIVNFLTVSCTDEEFENECNDYFN